MRSAWRVLAAISWLLLVACTPDVEEVQPQPSPSSPPQGGRVELGILGEPATLDPYGNSASELTYALVRPVLPMPFRMTLDGEPEPDLARSLETTASGARLTLEPREWSDGRSITARDVVASIRRATPPSGFAAIQKATVLRPRVVRLEGDVADWERTLATGAFVLPKGHLLGGNVSGGPFEFASYERGRRLIYEANEKWQERPLLDEIEISFVQGTELLIMLLQRGDLDAAWLPSSMNLSDRLEEQGISYMSARGSERLVLRSDPDEISAGSLAALVGEIDLQKLDSTFLRDDGDAIARSRSTDAAFPTSVSLAAPEGDELLSLLQRAIRLDLKRSGVTVELLSGPVSSLYGPWQDDPPADLVIQRAVAGGLPPRSIPMASLSTFLAWREEVHGLAVNPSLEGPLWNARDWWIEPSI